MTHILIFKSQAGEYKGFNCIGHAQYANTGEDIVCAAISILVVNTLNSLELITGESMSVIVNEAEGLINCQFDSNLKETSRVLMDSLVLGLNEIKKQYGRKYLDLTFEEV